ncbi:MAG: hypothetical protein JXR76_31510 [Deltaproteobacteria bacterium]|nr:hypothetical protein [Deltaproteobacteria bacterium]
MHIVNVSTIVFFLAASFISFRADAADEQIVCKVFTIEATNSGLGLDDSLKQYASIFTQKPFNAFNSFKLVSEKEYRLAPNQPLKLTLPEQLIGTLEYRGMSGTRLKLNLKLSRQDCSPILIEGTAGNGVPFMAAGLKSPNGRWVLAVKCKD